MTTFAKIEAPKTPFLRQYELVDRVRAYDPSVNEAMLNKAYVFSVKAHGEQKRHSGDPYYAHPIEVAGILASLHLDLASVCTALLHDVLEDTDTTYEDLAREFTPEIADLVDGVTKLGKLELSVPNPTRERQQAENFQKFVIAMSKDVRVLLVKLCDRLHNMRTLQYHPKAESRRRIALETMEIYAPLARRVGVDRICSELEELSFLYIEPTAHESLTKRLAAWRKDQNIAISEMSIALRDLMDTHDVEARIYGREKRVYAIWRKLGRQGISFEDIADIYAFRIIVSDAASCYRVLGILHQAFRSMPSRFRDFISVPKPNGYKSLHTTILGPNNNRVEVQIRTERMEDIAERGVAAHWAYKDESYGFDPESAQQSGSGDPLQRFRPLVEMMEYTGDADEFLEHAKLEMFTDQVFTYTPKSRLIALPRGATSLDFAYAVHTEVGDSCVGAIINGRERPLRTVLQNGDVVKIIRGGQARATPGWENMVVTGKARSAQRRLTRSNEVAEFHRIGMTIAEHAFAREDRDFSASTLTDALKRLGLMTVDALYETLGRGTLSVSEFMNAVFPGRDGNVDETDYADRDLINDGTVKMYVEGQDLTPGVSLHLAQCCSPISGDRIIGYQSEGKGIMIHTIDCDMLAELDDKDDRWRDLAWRTTDRQTTSTARIFMTIEHVPGALADITKIIGEAQGNLTNVKTLHRNSSFFDMSLDIEVRDTRHLLQIVAALRASVYVVSVERAHTDA